MDKNELFPPAAPDFSDPIGLLRACHDRILRHCDVLEAVGTRIAAGDDIDAEIRSAAIQIQRYFSSAGKHHHTDEEKDLFPRLARQSLKLADLVHRLRRQHEQLDALWVKLEPQLISPGKIIDGAAFAELCAQFAALEREHVASENADLLEMAQHILSAKELKEIGRNMAQRRGVQPAF